MNREEIEQQLKLSKKQNKEQRYDYLCSQFNCINYAIKLEKYTNKLQRENRELKKQLEEKENQQKEFIEYLEAEKDRLARECSQIYENGFGKVRLVSEDVHDEISRILEKYKEIIGVEGEQN